VRTGSVRRIHVLTGEAPDGVYFVTPSRKRASSSKIFLAFPLNCGGIDYEE
jgi:hypothetical protein